MPTWIFFQGSHVGTLALKNPEALTCLPGFLMEGASEPKASAYRSARAATTIERWDRKMNGIS